MKKKALVRGLLGFPMGIFVGYTTMIIVSLCVNDGRFYACTPQLAEVTGGEMSANILQYFMCGILGICFAAASVIWEYEKWSLGKQTLAYFAVLFCTFMPISYFAYWMEHSLAGFLVYLATFAGIFVFNWVTQYLVLKGKIRRLNDKVRQGM